MRDIIRRNLEEASTCLLTLLQDEKALHAIEQAGHLLVDTFQSGGKVFSCGNGGSMCDAMHFAEELSGKYRRDRKALGAAAISDPSYLTCVGNDYGYEAVFSRYIEGWGRRGDCLLAISTSGKSKNVLAAAAAARALGVRVIALVGQAGTPLTQMAEVVIATPGGAFADRVQEMHIKVIHNLIEFVERSLFPENYRDDPHPV